jgi:hypothetical protein
MLDSIDRWENEGGRPASQPTTALRIPAAAPPPIRTSGLGHLRDTPCRVAWGRYLDSCPHDDTVVKTMSQGSPR